MRWAAVLAALWALPATAQDRDLCADRPGLGTPPCIVDTGRVLVETGLIDWTRNKAPGERTDSVVLADTLVRIGVSDVAEVQLGWTPFGHQRQRLGGAVTTDEAIGDALLGLKLSLANPDGSGFSVALEPQLTLPIGRTPIGAGDWAATLVVPVSYELPGGFSLQASPQIAAAVDEDGDGRHLAWGGTVGLGIDLSDDLTAGLELQAVRDDDPAGASMQALAGGSLGWQRGEDLLLDVGVNAGLNHASDDLEIYAGLSRRF